MDDVNDFSCRFSLGTEISALMMCLTQRSLPVGVKDSRKIFRELYLYIYFLHEEYLTVVEACGHRNTELTLLESFSKC